MVNHKLPFNIKWDKLSAMSITEEGFNITYLSKQNAISKLKSKLFVSQEGRQSEIIKYKY